MPRYLRPSPTVEQLLALLQAGNYLETACRATGITVAQLGDWLERSPELAKRYVQAVATGEARAVARISRAADENWQAAAWLLERQYPERWSRPLARTTEDAAPAPAADALDELARKRAARRARLST